MPITLPPDLPAYDVLTREGVMVMSPARAAHQDIRPLRIGLLNLMPKKIQTENQFARLIGATPLQIDLQLIRRFDRAPKPMYYQPEFLHAAWAEYLALTGTAADRIDPDAFVRWTYTRALAHRQPRYEAMARNWGLTITAEDVARVRSVADFEDLISATLEAHG